MRFCSPVFDFCALVLLGSTSLLNPFKVHKWDMSIASISRGVLIKRSYSFWTNEGGLMENTDQEWCWEGTC